MAANTGRAADPKTAGDSLEPFSGDALLHAVIVLTHQIHSTTGKERDELRDQRARVSQELLSRCVR